MLKVEEGAYYRTRGGRIVGPMETVDTIDDQLAIGRDTAHGAPAIVFISTGRANDDNPDMITGHDYEDDLVERVPAPNKTWLKVVDGAFYKTRDGRVVGPTVVREKENLVSIDDPEEFGFVVFASTGRGNGSDPLTLSDLDDDCGDDLVSLLAYHPTSDSLEVKGEVECFFPPMKPYPVHVQESLFIKSGVYADGKFQVMNDVNEGGLVVRIGFIRPGYDACVDEAAKFYFNKQQLEDVAHAFLDMAEIMGD